MDQRNLLLAIVISVAILIGFQVFYDVPRQEAETAREQMLEQRAGEDPAIPPLPGPDGQPVPAPDAVPGLPDTPALGLVPGHFNAAVREAEIASGRRIAIESARVTGSVSLTGARVDDLALRDYRVTTDPTSPLIVLLEPAGGVNPYHAQAGWVAASPNVAVPGPDTVWEADRPVLSPGAPVTLRWDNGQDLVFFQELALDENYMITVTQRVQNMGVVPVTLHPYSLTARTGTPPTLGFFILHEGPVGVMNGTLREHSYSNLVDDGVIQETSTGGWLGITDKYWLVALLPPSDETVNTRFTHTFPENRNRYQADYLGAARNVAVGQTVEAVGRIFAGAKEVRLLDAYQARYGVDHFDKAVDFGWFYFLTKPMFYALDWLNRLVGNFGVAILILTVFIKLLFFPLANKSYKAMSKMRNLAPEMQKLRERYKDDKPKQQQELMALYRKEKINPASGCLPILIQIPVFIALYQVLISTIEMRHAPFYGWIEDLSVPDPTVIWNLFGLLPFDPSSFLPSFLLIGAWPILMALTMFLQQRISPQPPDPIQAKVFMFMPLIFLFLFATFPAGLVIYWTWNNLLSIAQQWFIMKRTEPKKT